MPYSAAATRLLAQLQMPVIAAPMFLCSGPQLVVAASTAGVLGTFPALNCRTIPELDTWLTDIKAKLGSRPYGVNIIVHKSNKLVEQHVDAMVRHKVPVVITSLGAVPSLVSRIHSYGGVVFHDVTNAKHAERAVEAGVDGIIAVCAGAGGHAGVLSPFALIPQLHRKFPDTVVIAAGALSTGSGIVGAIGMGAEMVSIGTQFIATKECMAQDGYKQMIAHGIKEWPTPPFVPIIYTEKISGIPANFMAESLKKAGVDVATLPPKVHGEYKANHNGSEVKAWRDVWSAGHSIVNINEVESVADVVSRMKTEAADAVVHVREVGRHLRSSKI